MSDEARRGAITVNVYLIGELQRMERERRMQDAAAYRRAREARPAPARTAGTRRAARLPLVRLVFGRPRAASRLQP